MAEALKAKMVDTKELIRLNKLSVENNYNQNRPDEFFEEVDPLGTHFLGVLIVHHHAQLKPVPPHFRCGTLVRMKDGEQVEILLDLPMWAFQSLQDAPPPEALQTVD